MCDVWSEHCWIECFTFLHHNLPTRAGMDLVELRKLDIVTNGKNIQDQWGHMNPALFTQRYKILDNLERRSWKIRLWDFCSPDLAFFRFMHFSGFDQIFPAGEIFNQFHCAGYRLYSEKLKVEFKRNISWWPLILRHVWVIQVTSDKKAHYHKDRIRFWEILHGPSLDHCMCCAGVLLLDSPTYICTVSNTTPNNDWKAWRSPSKSPRRQSLYEVSQVLSGVTYTWHCITLLTSDHCKLNDCNSVNSAAK